MPGSDPSLNVAKAAIEAKAREVQAMSEDIRWLFCDSGWIVAEATGAGPVEGRATALISHVLAAASLVRAELLVVRLASLLMVLRVWLGQFGVQAAPAPYFIGIRALREKQLLPQFEVETGRRVTFIDQRDPVALAVIGPVGLKSLIRIWSGALSASVGHLAAPAVSKGVRLAALNRLIRKLHIHSYSLAVFRSLQARDPHTPLAFSTSDLPAHAAVAAGLPAIFYQHGFLRRSLVFPAFKKAIALNAPEGAHIRARSPATEVSAPCGPGAPIAAERRLVLAGAYAARDKDVCRTLVEVALAAGLEVILRPHPADRMSFWGDLTDERVTIDRDGSFEAFMMRYRPAFLATWFSTTLFDALEMGIVPITLDPGQPDIVFPLQNVAVAWPAGRDRLVPAMGDEAVRARLVKACLKAFKNEAVS